MCAHIQRNSTTNEPTSSAQRQFVFLKKKKGWGGGGSIITKHREEENAMNCVPRHRLSSFTFNAGFSAMSRHDASPFRRIPQGMSTPVCVCGMLLPSELIAAV